MRLGYAAGKSDQGHGGRCIVEKRASWEAEFSTEIDDNGSDVPISVRIIGDEKCGLRILDKNCSIVRLN